MATKLNKNRTYLVLNYGSSPVAISLKNSSVLIPGGSFESPAMYPLELDEIYYVNNISRVFKNGTLFFEDEFQEAIYEELRLDDWRDILRNEQIESILLNPTVDGLERITAIKDAMYFERIYGIFTGLKNAGYALSSSVENVLKTRAREFADKKLVTGIVLRDMDVQPAAKQNAQMEEMQKQIDTLMAQIKEMSETKPEQQQEAAATRKSTKK